MDARDDHYCVIATDTVKNRISHKIYL